MEIIHTGFSHGLEPGTDHDMNCKACKQDLVYLRAYPEAREVYRAIQNLNLSGRTSNNSQIASFTRLSRSKVAQVVKILRQRHYIKDMAPEKCTAYHWRLTGKPMPAVPNGEPGPAGLSKLFPIGGSR